MGGFNISWGYAVTFLFTAGLGYMLTRFFNWEGPTAYMVTGLFGALGITVWTVYNHVFQKASDKVSAKKDALMSGGAGGAAGAAPAPLPDAAADGSIDTLVKEANQKITQSNVAQGGTLAN